MSDAERVWQVLDTCADRLESRADEFDQHGRLKLDETYALIAHVLRYEAEVIRAGCHRYPERPKQPQEAPSP